MKILTLVTFVTSSNTILTMSDKLATCFGMSVRATVATDSVPAGAVFEVAT